MIFPGSTQFGLSFSDAISDASWLGPVRFSSFPRPVPVGSRIKRFGSVRFGRFGLFGSVSYSFLKCAIWGCDNNFTNYTFKQAIESQLTLSFNPLARYLFLKQFKGVSEIIAGEIIMKSPYEVRFGF